MRRILSKLTLCIMAILPIGIAAADNVSKLKIGVIGAGHEGGALGSLFVKMGHPVLFSTRHPEQLKSFVENLGPLAKAGTVKEAVDFGDVILLVVPYPAMDQIAKDYGAALATKKLVMDVTNPIARRDGDEFVKKVMDAGGPGIVTAKLLPGAKIVRAFNMLSYAKLAEWSLRKNNPVAVAIAGDNQQAIDLASSLIREVGFEPVLVGGFQMGTYMVPGTPLSGEHTPAEMKQIASTLEMPSKNK